MLYQVELYEILVHKIHQHENTINHLQSPPNPNICHAGVFGLPVCLIPLVKCSDIVLIILLVVALNFPSIGFLHPRSKT